MRYVTPDGSFWEVTLAGRVVHARWGKGTSVKKRESTFKTVDLAKAELAALEKRVRKLGYRPEGAKPDGIAEALRERPTDDSPLIVHGDELLLQGDLRGEIATLVAQGKTTALGRFLRANATALFGAAENDVHEGFAAEFVWAPGFIREATLSTPDTTDVDELAQVTKRFLSAPVAEFVRELNFGVSYERWASAAMQVTRARHPELINALRFDAFDPIDVAVAEIEAGDFSEVWSRLPELRELRVRAGSMDTGELAFPELRFFSRTGGMASHELRAITRAHWPKLERLELGFEREDRGDPTIVLHWLFQKPQTIKHLALRGLDLSVEQVEELFDSSLLKQLRTLDLSDVGLDEDAAEALTDNAESLSHLEKLSSPWLVDEDGTPTIAVLEELENHVDDAFDD